MSASDANTRLKIGVWGVGMVGSPLARWFEQEGWERGRNLFLFDKNARLNCDDDITQADLIFVAVPTPPNEDGSCNTSIVEEVVGQIRDGTIIVLKSTIPPGTTYQIQERYPKKLLLFNPEFLTESRAWSDFIRPSRQIIGVTEQSFVAALDVLNTLPEAVFSRPFKLEYSDLLSVSSTEAELVKYLSNVFGSLKVWFSNMAANFCWVMNRTAELDGAGPTARYESIRPMLAADQRYGRSWSDVNQGHYYGFGGFCFPKDFAAFKFELLWWRGQLLSALGDAESDDLHDWQMLRVLEADLQVLEAVWNANAVLLEAQNLTVKDVSYHDKEIVLAKHRPVRILDADT